MAESYDLICIGMALIDSIIKGFNPEPVSASGYRAGSGTLNAGGEAVNGAVAAARLGLKTGILCALGNDSAGEMVLHTLRQNGVDTSMVLHPDNHSTPVTTMFVNEDGTRKSITNSSHRFQFHPEKEAEHLSGARALILGSLFRSPFDDPEVIHAVLEKAKAAGQIVFADTKLPNFRRLSLEDLRDSLPLIDYITPNEDEAEYYSGQRKPEAMADVFLEKGVKNVVIKLGSKGCLFKNTKESCFLPAFDIKAVDATGAGDNFLAGFASEIIRGKGWRDALLFANACGAICTTAVGAGTALKNREQVLNFIESEGAVNI